MKISDINPNIRYARVHRTYFRTKKDINKCYDCRIFFFNNATGSVTINEKKYNILAPKRADVNMFLANISPHFIIKM